MPPLTNAPHTPVACRRPLGDGNAWTIRPRPLARSAALAAPWAIRARADSQVDEVKAPGAVVRPSGRGPGTEIRARPEASGRLAGTRRGGARPSGVPFRSQAW